MSGDRQILAARVGIFDTNCYILLSEKEKKAVIVDPGGNAGVICSILEENGAEPEAVLLTHGHNDHIGGLPELLQKYPGLPVYAAVKELPMLTDPSLNSGYGGKLTVSPDRLLEDGDVFTLCGTKIEVLETPGHTAGSICYYLPDEQIVFAGDTLFRHGYGRYDLPTGSREALIGSLRKLFEVLPEETAVLPGHGAATRIEDEKSALNYLVK